MKREMKPSTALAPSPVILLSVSSDGTTNIITLSWASNICSDPPSVAVGIRPARYSHALISAAGEFVLNIPSVDLLQAAVFCGTKSGRDHNKFAECGLTPIPASRIKSPMIKECPVNLECRITGVFNVGAHDLFIAEIVAVHMDDSVLTEDGKLDLSKARPFVYSSPSGQYWSLGEKL